MFCSGKKLAHVKKEGCLCEECEVFRKFGLDGVYFCQQTEKSESPEEGSELPTRDSDNFSINWRHAAPHLEKTRFCVLNELSIN